MAKNDDNEAMDIEDAMGALVPATSADVVPNDSHVTVRQNRTVTIHFAGSVGIDVIEPPMVFSAEIEQAVTRAVMAALSSIRLGAASAIRIRTSASKMDEDSSG